MIMKNSFNRTYADLGLKCLSVHDNAPAHRERQTIETAERCGFEILPHPPYSQDLASSDFCLFPNLKKFIKGRRFEDITDAITAVEAWF
ncbi:histone-lysine N-methyltransferase SETMAR [Elysia marginata]|uniref:Histone-lysine N-methyltransferase SETMAR n=1 Tax=Elysia marginata TaxID=1093978 RepID=A0AAV4EQN5_9GAST|nr:histone-lysine N-methyltransferase SETMAR [Elysia marginata]